MSNILEKKFFYLFIILQPILDLLTSFMSRNMDLPLTIGIIARSLFMVYMFIDHKGEFINILDGY